METDSFSNFYRDYESPINCPVCFSSRLVLAFPPDVIQCQACQVYVRSPRPTQSEVLRFYNTGVTYQHWANERKIRDYLWQIRMNRILGHVRSGRLLDIGTGDGHFLELCQKVNFTVEATEISSRGLELCRSRGFNPRLGAVTDLNWDGKRYDVITVWHVLEHLLNPGETLSSIYKLLKPGGLLAVAVPNEETRLFPHRWWPKPKNPLGELVWGNELHIIYFQPQTLRATLIRWGFEIVEFGVDQVETHPRWWTEPVKRGHEILSALTHWHLSTAMYALARKPAINS